MLKIQAIDQAGNLVRLNILDDPEYFPEQLVVQDEEHRTLVYDNGKFYCFDEGLTNIYTPLEGQ